MTALELLEQARELLANPSHWCKGWFAKDAEGKSLHGEDFTEGVSWCLVGALYKVNERIPLLSGRTPELSAAIMAMDTELDRIQADAESLSEFNDSSTHEEVLRFLNNTILSLKLKEGAPINE